MPKFSRAEAPGFSGGLNLKATPYQLLHSEAVVATNLDRDTSGALRQRNGNELHFKLPTDRAIVGVYDYQHQATDGRYHQHLAVDDRGELWMVDAEGTPIAISGWFDPGDTEFASFAMASADCYIATGNGRLTVYSPNERCYAGITAPVDTPMATPDVPGTGVMIGKYKYVVTYYYTTPDGRTIESNPGPESLQVDVGDLASGNGAQVTLTWAAPPDNGERIGGYRIYRTVANGTQFLRAKEIPDLGTLAWIDNTEDLSLDANGLVFYDHSVPKSGATIACFYAGSLFLAGFADAPGTVVMSKTNEFEHFPILNYIVLTSNTTSKITAMYEQRGTLYIGRENEMWAVTGTSPANFVPRRVTTLYGCASPASIVDVGDLLLFASPTGVVGWTGSKPIPLSQRVDPLFDGVPLDSLRLAQAAVLSRRRQYLLSYRFPDGKVRVLVFNFANVDGGDSESTTTSAWFVFEGIDEDVFAPRSMCRAYTFDERREFLLWGSDDGRLVRFDEGQLDLGKPIESTYQFYFAPTTSGQDERAAPKTRAFMAHHWIVTVDQWDGEATFSWGYYQTDFARPGGFVDSEVRRPDGVGPQQIRIDCGNFGYGRFVGQIKHTGVGPLRITSSELLFTFVDEQPHGNIRGG